MREVGVESLRGVEVTDGEVRVLARDERGELVLVFPRPLFEDLVSEEALEDSSGEKPTAGELEELMLLERRLEERARKDAFDTVVKDVPFGGGGSGGQFDLVLRPTGMLAATTGYLFLPEVRPEHVALIGAQLDEDNFIEGAYLIGAVADERALAAGDEGLKVLSVRNRRCSSSRFELTPELWRVLSEDLGWKNVEPVVPR